MKKLFFLSSMIGLMAGSAAAVDIYSCNTVGVQRVTGTISEVSVPVPFVGIGGQDATLKSLLYIDNLQTGAGIQTCVDNQYGFYNVWTALNLPEYGLWDYVAGTRTMNSPNGGVVDVVAPEASEAVVSRGIGLKVTRTNRNSPVYVMGEYTDKPVSTTVSGKTRSYLVNPLAEDFDLDAKLNVDAGVDWDDVIYVEVNGTTRTYFFDDYGEDGKYWYYELNTTVNGKIKKQFVYDSPKIKSGAGFIYQRGATRGLTFTW